MSRRPYSRQSKPAGSLVAQPVEPVPARRSPAHSSRGGARHGDAAHQLRKLAGRTAARPGPAGVAAGRAAGAGHRTRQSRGTHEGDLRAETAAGDHADAPAAPARPATSHQPGASGQHETGSRPRMSRRPSIPAMPFIAPAPAHAGAGRAPATGARLRWSAAESPGCRGAAPYGPGHHAAASSARGRLRGRCGCRYPR